MYENEDFIPSELSFPDPTPKEVVVWVGPQPYVLREAGEDAVCKWRNYHTRVARYVDGEWVGPGDLADSAPLLVSMCLFRADADPSAPKDSGRVTIPRNEAGDPDPSRRVPVATVRSWPHRIVGPIHNLVMKISKLLEQTQTADQIRKAIDRLKKDLVKIESAESNGKSSEDEDPESPKNSPAVTRTTSE